MKQLEFQWDGAEPEAPVSAPPPARETPAAPKASAPERPAPRNTPAVLQAKLARYTKRRIALHVTSNRTRMISYKYKRDGTWDGLAVRLHHMFLDAEDELLKSLGHWLLHPRSKKAGNAINRFIRENRDKIAEGKARPITVDTKGVCFDLQVIFDDLNRRFFQGGVHARITWGNFGTARRQRSIRFGSYTDEHQLIRIHPRLDQTFVPRYFVEFVVYHEMLHAFLGTSETTASGRRKLHTRQFKKLERAFPEYERAVAWENNPKNLRHLLKG